MAAMFVVTMDSDCIVFENPFVNNGYILVEKDVLDLINSYRQDQPDKLEAGGLIAGFYRGNHIHVCFATTPQKRDKRSRYSFERIDPEHQNKIEKLWLSSGGLVAYLGEWHTHPETTPKPSSIDNSNWLKLFRIHKSQLVFIIGSCESLDFSCYYTVNDSTIKLLKKTLP